MDQILEYLRITLGLSDNELLRTIRQTAYINHYEKGSFLLRQGECPDGFCVLINGILRGYFLDKDGTDITDCFGYRMGTIAMPFSDMSMPSPINIEVLEASDIFIIPRHTMQELLTHNFEAVQVYNRILLAGATEHWEIKNALYQYSATDRYIWFTKRYEGLIDLVAHKYVASFLGISPVTLSRLRGKIKAQPDPSN